MTATLERDSSMDTLLPRPSRARNAVILLAALGLVFAAWWSPKVLRPGLSDTGGRGTWSALGRHNQVFTEVEVAGAGWPSIVVRGVMAVPGASVAGAWLVDSVEGRSTEGRSVTVDPDDFASGLDVVRAVYPEIDVDAALPQRIGEGERAVLVVLWSIDDCDLLDADGSADTITVDVRSIVGVHAAVAVDAIVHPGFDVPTLRQSATCPEP